MSVEVETVKTPEALAARADEWDALAVRCARRGLLAATHPWFASYVEHRLEGRSWACLFARRRGALVGVLPLVRRRHAVLRMRRPWLWVPNDVHAGGGDALVDGAHAAAVLPRLIGAALETRPHPIGLLFGGLVPDSPTLVHLLERPDVEVATEDLAGRALALEGGWAACLEMLGANLRRNLRKARNRLAHLGSVQVRRFDDAAPLERFLELEAAGWKGASGGAVACQPALKRFYAAMCERLAARGRLEWHFLELDGRPLAGALALRYGAQVILLRVAHDEEHARFSPGQILMAEMLEAWFEEGGLALVDCLTDQPWHRTWHMERAPYAAARVRAGGVVAWVAGEMPARLRGRLKRIRCLRRWIRRLRGEEAA